MISNLPKLTLQIICLLIIVYGVFLITYFNDLRTSKEKKKDILIGIILISIGSAILFTIWFSYFITYPNVL